MMLVSTPLNQRSLLFTDTNSQFKIQHLSAAAKTGRFKIGSECDPLSAQKVREILISTE